MATIEAVAKSFLLGRPNKCYNARTDGTSYWLYNSIICRYRDTGLHFDWGHYYTRATASHMNAILDEYNAGFRVSYAQARDNGLTTFDVR